MYELLAAVPLVLFVAGVVVAVRERRTAQTWRVSEQPPPPTNIQAVFVGRQDYYTVHQKELAIIEAAALVEQRKSGRQLGEDYWVEWEPGRDEEVDKIFVPYLVRFGKQNGVTVRQVKR